MRDKALQFIGAEIQTYGHFEVYSIPYESGESITAESDITEDEFIRLTYEYFTDKTRINKDYGDDLKYQNQCKRFIRNRVNDESFDVGKIWISERKFKNK